MNNIAPSPAFVLFRDTSHRAAIVAATRIHERQRQRLLKRWRASTIFARVDGLQVESPSRKA